MILVTLVIRLRWCSRLLGNVGGFGGDAFCRVPLRRTSFFFSCTVQKSSLSTLSAIHLSHRLPSLVLFKKKYKMSSVNYIPLQETNNNNAQENEPLPQPSEAEMCLIRRSSRFVFALSFLQIVRNVNILSRFGVFCFF